MRSAAIDAYTKLQSAVLTDVAFEKYRCTRVPGANDDDEAGLNEERVIGAARELVALTQDVEVLGG